MNHYLFAGTGGASASMASVTALKRGEAADWHSVKWKDREHKSPGTNSAALKEVNASLSRLDKKILHLETLLAKLTDRLSQKVEQVDQS